MDFLERLNNPGACRRGSCFANPGSGAGMAWRQNGVRGEAEGVWERSRERTEGGTAGSRHARVPEYFSLLVQQLALAGVRLSALVACLRTRREGPRRRKSWREGLLGTGEKLSR